MTDDFARPDARSDAHADARRDPFADSDAAYLLGALDPAEEEAFEAHLAACADCRSRVADLDPVAGLLTVLPKDLARTGLTDDAYSLEPVPDTLLPRLLRAARTERRRSRTLTVALAGLAAACVLALAVALWPSGSTAGPARRPMVAVAASPVSATAAVTARAWGTQIDLVCSYDGTVASGYAYRLVVHDRSGGSEVLGTWTLVPGREVHYRSGTALTPSQISSIEIGLPDGRPLLRLTT